MRLRDDDVAARSSVGQEATVSAVEEIISSTAEEGVSSVSTVNGVVARSSAEDVVGAQPEDDVVASKAHDHVRAVGSNEDVVALCPDDGGLLPVARRRGGLASAASHLPRGRAISSDRTPGAHVGAPASREEAVPHAAE